MDSLSGIFRKPIVAAAAVTLSYVYSDVPDKFWPAKPCDQIMQKPKYLTCASQMTVPKFSNLSYLTHIRVPVSITNFHFPDNLMGKFSTLSYSHVAYSLKLRSLYQSAQLYRSLKANMYTYTLPILPSEAVCKWHLPKPVSYNVLDNSNDSSAKSRTVVVLLGWLGAKQKHLNKYVEWYTSNGFHAVTFTFPMAEIISYQVGGNSKAEENVDLLVRYLADWFEKEHGKNLVFHTFSNTGWLTYGVILQKFRKENPSLTGRIIGCIVDSAPVAVPDPQVWASGFSAAFLKKHSVATKGSISDDNVLVGKQVSEDVKPAITEAALLLILEKFFKLVLNLPKVNRWLSDVVYILSSEQPSCPQLYIYSSADRVIPSGSVESFIESQRKSGRKARACNFVSTPHVDHFRNDPKLYTCQLSQFFDDCALTNCKDSSEVTS